MKQSEPNERDKGQVRRRARAGADTRTTLILTAERIFSEEGISNTPLRRITQAAGQRNESAVHYHFGSREGIVAAIMEYRTVPVNAARMALLEKKRAAAGGLPLSSRDVAEILFLPLADHLRQHGGASYYIRFLAMLWLDQPMWRMFEGRAMDTGLIEALHMLMDAMPHLPESLVRQRFGLALQMVTYSLARMERFASKHGEHFDRDRADADIAGIVDAGTAIFDAPVSPPTIAALRQRGAFGDRARSPVRRRR